VSVKLLDGLRRCFVVAEFDESEAARAAGGAVGREEDFDDVSGR